MTHRNQSQSNKISRRRFLGTATCAAMGSTGMFSSLLNLRMIRNAAAQELDSGDDYKAIVCIYLAGGNDSYNMLVPTNDEEYANYQYVRNLLALGKDFDANIGAFRNGLYDLQTLDSPDRTFGLHWAMPEVNELYNNGNLAFIANTGTLVQPTTVADFKNGSMPVPHQLFSHSDQTKQWQTSVPIGSSKSGWAGRMADLLHSTTNQLSQTSMNISLAGRNIMQTGDYTSQYIITPNGSVSLIGKNSGANSADHIRYELVGTNDADQNSFAGQLYGNLFKEAYMDEFQASVANEVGFADAFNNVSLSTPFNPTNKTLSNTLSGVARTIAAREELGMRRQVFFVQVAGWDFHANLLEDHSYLLAEVSEGMKDFWDALVELGVEDSVVTYTASDFARSLRTNGSGSDHAWGGNQMIMGGSVRGSRIHGKYPDASELQLGSGLDVGRTGQMLPTTSVDEYFAEMALWFGVPYNQLDDVVPNIRNFYNPDGEELPIGYLDIASMPETAFPSETAQITGDVNCDMTVNLIDAVLIQQYDTFLLSATNSCTEASTNQAVYISSCDMNEDGQCGLVDSIIIKQCNVFISNPFCQ